MILNLNLAQIRRIIEALEAQAHATAGHSQRPYLINKEDTQDWHDAEALRKMLREHRKSLKAPPL